MPMLPIPAFAALVLAWLALRQGLQGQRLLAAFLALCAVQSALVALTAGYGVTVLRPILPVTASMIPALAWVTYRTALYRPLARADLLHLAGPLFVAFARIFAPETVDVAVSSLFVAYGAALWWSLRHAPDLPLPRIGAGVLPARLWQRIGALLVASGLGDGLIALAYILGHGDWAGWLISLFASGTLLVIGMIGSAPEAVGAAPDTAEPTPEPDADDHEICRRLDAILRRDKLFLDPDLTLQRLARRLHLPEKAPVGGGEPCHRRQCLTLHQRLADHACLRVDRGGAIHHRGNAGFGFQHEIELQP